jgi:large subunit ribosomal protein L23
MNLTEHDTIKYMMRTEKSARDAKLGKYLFCVNKVANKIQIKRAVEVIYNVKVEEVNTVISPGKWRRVGKSEGRKPDWKKAVVTLKSGYKIEQT